MGDADSRHPSFPVGSRIVPQRVGGDAAIPWLAGATPTHPPREGYPDQRECLPQPAPNPGKLCSVIFKRVGEGRPYPDHGWSQRQWAALAPVQVRLDELTTTKPTLDLETLLQEDSTFYGDLFAHVVAWRGELYLEDGLHRALRAALQQRQTLHARVLELDV